jgi:hypothetical protein
MVNSQRRALALASLLTSWWICPAAFAESTGEQSISAFSALDVFRITCGKDSRGLRANVSDLQAIQNPSQVIVTILKDGTAETRPP